MCNLTEQKADNNEGGRNGKIKERKKWKRQQIPKPNFPIHRPFECKHSCLLILSMHSVSPCFFSFACLYVCLLLAISYTRLQGGQKEAWHNPYSLVSFQPSKELGQEKTWALSYPTRSFPTEHVFMIWPVFKSSANGWWNEFSSDLEKEHSPKKVLFSHLCTRVYFSHF